MRRIRQLHAAHFGDGYYDYNELADRIEALLPPNRGTNRMIVPTQDRMVVVPSEEVEKMTDGGLHIPDMAQEKPVEGVIIAVGPGTVSAHTGEIIPIRHSKGQKVLYGKYAGTEIVHDGETLLILREPDIFAVVVENE